MTRGPDVLPRVRPAPVRDGLQPSRAVPRAIQRAKYRARLIADGRCVCCYHKRGWKATDTMCRPCANKHTKHARERTRNRVDAGLCVDCGKGRGDSPLPLNRPPTRHRCRTCQDKHNAQSRALEAVRACRESAAESGATQ